MERTRVRVQHVVTALATLLAACGGGGTATDMGTGPGTDLGGGTDGGMRDSGAVDMTFDSPAPVCTGTSTACTMVDPIACATAGGCSLSMCAGTSAACDSLTTAAGCGAQSGCAWSGTQCSGTAVACDAVATMDRCMRETGCGWTGAAHCAGFALACARLTAAQCDLQPGCMQIGGPPPPPPDLGPPDLDLPDSGCGSATGTASFDVHVVFGPDPVVSAASVGIHLESPCGAPFDVTTDGGGMAHLDLDRAMGPWTMTAAAAHYDAVSIVAVSELAPFTGDVRLDPEPFPTATTAPASGHVSGGGAAGHTVRVDGFDFGTTNTDASGNWSSSLYVFPWADPVQFAAVELDAAGSAVNGVIGAMSARSSAGISGVALALPSPAVAPVVRAISVHGLSPTASLTFAEPMVILDAVTNDPYVFVGSGTFTSRSSLEARWFTAMLPTEVRITSTDPGVGLVNVQVHDLATTDVTVPPVTPLIDGTTLDDVRLLPPGDPGWDVAMLDVGESAGVPPGWRIIVPRGAPMRSVGAPHLPAGLTTADLGLAGSVGAISLLVKSDTGRVWSSMSSSGPPPDWAISAGGNYFTLDVSGR